MLPAGSDGAAVTTIVIRTEGGWSHGFEDFDAYYGHVATVVYCYGGNVADLTHLAAMDDAIDGFFAL